MAEKHIAFTFDDGPNTTVTPLVAKLFEDLGGHATFFLVGNNITDETAEVVRSNYLNGHEIASHSLTHSDMTKFTADEISYEMEQTDMRVKAVIGHDTFYFRPPYIAYDQQMFDTIDKPFICGRGVDDWDKSVTTGQRIEGLLEKAEDGGIILLHDQEDNYSTVKALETVLPALKEQGYEFVTLSELFRLKGVKPLTDRPIIYSNVIQTENTYE
ncbi:MAG: polysaccharide deacetylase family protein [Ruminococcus sp.]|nr:polysaccharide deacetylase family protein [Ruminococcus sp.]